MDRWIDEWMDWRMDGWKDDYSRELFSVSYVKHLKPIDSIPFDSEDSDQILCQHEHDELQ